MKITKLLLICLCCLIAVPAVWGQAGNSPAKPGILGYLDPQTGAFRPLPAVAEESPDAPAAVTFTGTITVTLTVTVKSTGLTTYFCSANSSVVDAATTAPRFYTESNTVAATGSGTTRTCIMTIPYAWSLASQSSDTMTTSYSVVGSGGTNVLPQRTNSSSPLDTRKVPANGTTTALTAAVTI